MKRISVSDLDRVIKKRSKLIETLLQAATSVVTDQRALFGVRSPRIIDFHSLSRSVGTFKTSLIDLVRLNIYVNRFIHDVV